MKSIPVKEIPKEEAQHLVRLEQGVRFSILAPEHEYPMLEIAVYFRNQTFELRERLADARDAASRLEFPDTTGR